MTTNKPAVTLPATLSLCERDALDVLKNSRHPLTLQSLQTQSPGKYTVPQLRIAVENLCARGLVNQIAQRYAAVQTASANPKLQKALRGLPVTERAALLALSDAPQPLARVVLRKRIKDRSNLELNDIALMATLKNLISRGYVVAGGRMPELYQLSDPLK